MNVSKHLLQIFVILTVIAVPGIALAQTSSGTLVGAITDPTGAVVPNAAISAVSAQYGIPHETRTDSVGTYRLEGLQPGTYTVTITAKDFKILSVTGVIINGSLTTTINGKLELAAAQQALEVQASAAQAIDTQSGQLGGNIGHQEVTQLPYATLNPAELALTLPGVQDSPIGNGAIYPYAQTEGVSFSVNGSRPHANNFLVDGQDDNDYGISGQAYQPTNVGAIQEVTVLTNSYSAEYGRGGGSVTNYIYKSGTNNIHGDLWEINRNSAFAAIPAQDSISNSVTKNPYDNENTFGFDVGGPIVKDKLFFFGTAQWDRERQAATGPVFSLPTAAGIATLKSLEPNPNISLFLNAIGPLVSPGLTGVSNVHLGNSRPDVEIGNFQVQNVRTASNAVDWNWRMDWHITDHDTLTGSALRETSTLSPDIFANAKALPNFQTQQAGASDIFRGQWQHTVSSTILNELRLSYTNIDLSFGVTPATASGPLANIPFITFAKDINFPSIGVDPTFPQGRGHKIWQVQEALSYSAGQHTIKAGVDVTILRLADQLALNTRGTISYAAGGGYSSLANFIDDYTGADPGTISKSFGNRNINSSATMFAPYIEDTWRAKSNLTVNMGLRYEYWGALANALPYPAFDLGLGFGALNGTYPDMYASRQIPDKRNFAPRIGLAYTPHWGQFLFGEDKTTFRAGYGIFYDGLFTTITDNTATYQPNTLGGGLGYQPGRGTPNASTTGIGSITPAPNPHLLIYTMANNLHNPLTEQWNANMERELPLGLVMTVAYVGTRGEHLFASQDFNPQVGYSYMNPNFGEIAVRTNAGDSWYNAAQVEVTRKFHSSLFLRAAYTYSKFYDDVSGVSLISGLSAFSQDLTNQRSDWGPSTFDRRHRLTVSYVWQVPYFKQNAFLRALTDRWQWSGIATIETGTPNTVQVGYDNIGNGHPNARPDLANPAAPLDSLGVDGAVFGLPAGTYDWTCLVFTNNVCPAEPYNTFHFVIPNYVPGNVGRNSVFGPGQFYFDTAIQRDFPVHFWHHENQTISIRMDMLNAFNHPNLFTPSYNMYDVNYNNTAITINGGRQIKFWLKYSF
ncbi:MAG TPA: carboxypeptidase regulatory-like domain-containing protein [Candidatus Dormibacteraeota bacterium]|nr:carboxypeptidase regulatory-like domain-containing protein [Candidatus Dormibacteraeota bacterium]